MAPSSRTRTTQQPRLQVPVFRVTKSSRLNERPLSLLKQKIGAIENAVSENAPLPVALSGEATATTKISKKRRRDSDAKATDVDNSTHANTIKRVKKAAISSLLKTTTSKEYCDREVDQLPELLQELSQLHKHLMHALSVHFAHNKGGIRDVIDLAALLPTMTRLWRKRTLQVHDVQRILALWELQEMRPDSTGGSDEVQHAKGPFRVEQVGIAMNATTTLEYTWTNSGDAFVETELQRQYEIVVRRLFTLHKDCQQQQGPNNEEVVMWRNLDDVPKLRCEMSQITQQRRERVASIKSHILSKTPAQQQPDLSSLSIHGPDSPPRQKQIQESAIKSRTMNLFDRVRAKQLLNATAASMTPAQMLRQRAVQRIPELVDVLRLKQARKVSGQNFEMQSTQMQMKVSFSFEALVQEIKDSLRAEVASDEIREGITVLGREMSDGWCRVYEMGNVKCVTLQGEAMSRKDIEGWCRSVGSMTVSAK